MTASAWRRATTLLLLLAICAGMARSGPAAAQSGAATAGGGGPLVSFAAKHDVSPNLRDIALQPSAGPARAAPLRRLHATRAPARPSAERDPVAQLGPVLASMPATEQNFEGSYNVDGFIPPDTNGDVGPNHYVQWINSTFAVWDKRGNLLYGPAQGNSLWAGFGGPCEETNDGDPIVQYDHLADRWMLSQFANAFTNGPYYQCIAISRTGDPTGAYYRYAFMTNATKLGDYPKFGVWPDAYYMSINQFEGNNYGGAAAVAFERDKMLAGRPARMILFDLLAANSNFGGMLPSDLEGPPPPAGAPAIFAEVDDSSFIGPSDAMRLWRFHVDWANPASSTFGLGGQPNNVLPVAPFTPYSGGIPQPAGAPRLDDLADRLMYRMAYRNFGDHQALVINHTVDAGGGRAGVRWYEVRNPAGAPTIFQQGTYAPGDGNHRWMASLALDRQGNLALGYSVSGVGLYPSIRYTGRLAGDPLGTLPQGEATIQAGGGVQLHQAARWGDYSSMSVDVDGCTFWFTSEYYASTSALDFRTRIASFKFPSCSAAATGKLQGSVTSAAGGAPVANATVSAGAYSTSTDAAGHYQFLNLPPGAYNVTASAYGYTGKTVNGVTVTAGGTTTQNFALAALAAATVTGAVTDSSGHGWPLYARIEIAGSGYPANPLFTDPVTGRYSVTLLQGVPFTLTVSAVSPGYFSTTRVVTPPAGASTQNFALAADLGACAAPGYGFGSTLFSNGFEGGFPPAGWSVFQTADPGPGWQQGGFGTPGSHGSPRSGAAYAWHNDDLLEQPTQLSDDWLVTPPISVPAGGAALTFWQREVYPGFYLYHGVWATTGSNPNPGVSNYTELYSGTADVDWAEQTVSLNAYASKTIRLAFRYAGNYSDEWYLDDLAVRNNCQIQAGGLVVGSVTDANTNAGLNGATVGDGAGNTATSFATPEDPAQGDGFYILATPAGTRTLTATAPDYPSDAKTVSVTTNAVKRQDFALKSGRLSATPTSIALTLLAGQTASRSVTIANSGGSAASFNLAEVSAAAPALAPQRGGPFAEREERRVDLKHDGDRDASATFDFEPEQAPALSAGSAFHSWATGLAAPWGIGFNTTANDLWLSNPALIGGDNKDRRYSTSGVSTTDTIDTSPWVGGFAADMTFNPFTGMLWQVNVGGDNCIYELDPAKKTATGGKICPFFGTSERGLAYNPLDNTFYAGSWNDGIISHFDTTGRLLDSADVNLEISGLAFNPATGHLFVMRNHPLTGGRDVYVLDVNDGYAVVGSFNVEGMLVGGGAGLEIDCAGHLWAVDQVSRKVIEADSGETGVCDWKNVPWLSESPASASVPAGGSRAITLTINAGNLPSGTYRAHLRIGENTPYAVRPIDITLTVLNYNKVFIPVVKR